MCKVEVSTNCITKGKEEDKMKRLWRSAEFFCREKCWRSESREEQSFTLERREEQRISTAIEIAGAPIMKSDWNWKLNPPNNTGISGVRKRNFRNNCEFKKVRNCGEIVVSAAKLKIKIQFKFLPSVYALQLIFLPSMDDPRFQFQALHTNMCVDIQRFESKSNSKLQDYNFRVQALFSVFYSVCAKLNLRLKFTKIRVLPCPCVQAWHLGKRPSQVRILRTQALKNLNLQKNLGRKSRYYCE